MNIGIDYISAIGTGGSSVYTKELVDALIKIDKDNKYCLFYFFHDFFPGRKLKKIENKNFQLKPAYFSKLKFPIPIFIINFINKVSLRIFAKLNKIDVFHFTNPLNFVKGDYKSVVTIHDISILHNENWVVKFPSRIFKKKVNNILNRADKIITDAEFTKNDLVEFLNADKEKIKPILLATSNIFHFDGDVMHFKKKLNLENYILYIGEMHPRKNILGLLEAYSKMDVKLRQSFNLILAGINKSSDFDKKIKETIKNLNIEKEVKALGFIAENDLPKLYSGAKFLIYPSFFEGFGFPVLESINCGTPVITSNTSSMPEVAGDAGILINPENIDEMKQAMEKLLLDNDFYQKLKNKCAEQASKFSWQKTAKATLAVYNETYKN